MEDPCDYAVITPPTKVYSYFTVLGNGRSGYLPLDPFTTNDTSCIITYKAYFFDNMTDITFSDSYLFFFDVTTELSGKGIINKPTSEAEYLDVTFKFLIEGYASPTNKASVT